MRLILPASRRRNAPWTPLQRRTWLAEQRRRHRVALHSVAAPAVPLPTALAGYWRLDEAANTVRANAVPGGPGLSEWSCYATTPTINPTTGKIGNAAAIIDGLNWGLRAAAYSGCDAAADFSLSCWVRFTRHFANPYQTVFYLGQNHWLTIQQQQDTIQFAVGINPSGNALVQTASHSLVEGLWTHVVAVKSSATLQLYLNGVLSVSGPIAGTVRTEILPDLRLGCGPAANALNGALDEFGLWQRALSAADVVRLYNNGAGLAYELF